MREEVLGSGKKIRSKRISMGITAKEAAAMLEIPYTTYCNYENGNREPRLSALRKIASCFNVPLSSLTDFGKFSTDELYEDFEEPREIKISICITFTNC